MSVITSFPATPNRIEIVWAFLLQRRAGDPIKRDELQQLVGPRSLSKDLDDDEESTGTTILDSVLSEMIRLELVERDADLVSLTASAPKGDSTELLAYLETALLDPNKAEQYGQTAFPLAMSWFLSQDPAEPMEWSLNHSGKVNEDCGEGSASTFELRNPALFQQFIYWARYLGFAWRLQSERSPAVNVLLPDPSVAIWRHIPEIMRGQGQCEIDQVLNSLADRLPVLEGGVARTRLENLLSTEKARPAGQYSRSTTFALKRLQGNGLIWFDSLDDATNVFLLETVSGPEPVSHIALIEEH